MSGVKSPDMIFLRDGPAAGYNAGWNGEWPPPDTFTVAIGKQTGMISIVGEIDAATAYQLHEIADVMTYRLRNASTLPDDFASPHVFRGADYVIQDENSHEAPE